MTAVRESQLHAEYVLAREAQDLRCEAATGGYPEEVDRYYGRGEYAGMAVEPRITWQAWLQSAAGERIAWEEEQARIDLEVGPEPPEDSDDYEPAPADLYTVGPAPCSDPRDTFRMTGARLAMLAAAGDRGAQDEITRRATRRATKRAARTAR